MSVQAELREKTFRVRQACDLEMTLRSTVALEAGQTVEAQFPHSWMLVTGPSFTRRLQADDPGGEHYISVEATAAQFRIEFRQRTLHCPGGIVRHGRHIVATLVEGQVLAGGVVVLQYANTFAPYVAETDRVWLSFAGQAPDEPPTLTVTPAEATSMRIITPSSAEPGRTFEVLVVSLDEFDNASCSRYEDQTLSVLGGGVLVSGLSFTGSARVPVRLDEPGVYRLAMKQAVSNPIRVESGRRGPYWGDIHVHTRISHDGQGSDPFGYARSVSGLDFAGTADHCQSTGPAGYAQQMAWAQAAYEPGRFVTILGDERNPGDFSTDKIDNLGHYNVYFRDVEAFWKYIGRPESGPFVNMLAAGRPEIDPAEAMFVPHHTGISWGTEKYVGAAVHADDALAGRELRPAIEIYSHHGQSEYYAPQHVLAYELNRMRNPERRTNTSWPGPYYAQDYWQAGMRMGVLASSDEHSGQGGRPHGGIAAVFTDRLTREGLFDAIRYRDCYATTGERILLDFSVEGLRMGREGRFPPGRPLRIRLKVWATELILRVEILKCVFGQGGFRPVLSKAPRPESLDAAFEIDDEFASPSMYYARVMQNPVSWPGMAWTSPIWIDAEE